MIMMRNDNTTYIKYLFSDKKASLYWIIIFLGLIILTGLTYLIKKSVPDYYDQDYRTITVFTMLILTIIIYIWFYTSGYINLKLQNRFKELNKNTFQEYRIVDVELHQNSFTIKPFRQNYDARINIKPRLDRFEMIKINSLIYLLGQVYEMGLFRKHLKPILILTDTKKTGITKKILMPKIQEISKDNNNLITRFDKSLKGINTLIIKDYELPSSTNTR